METSTVSSIESDFEGIYEATGIMNQEGFLFYHIGCLFLVADPTHPTLRFSAKGFGDDFGISVSDLEGSFSKPVKDLEGDCRFNLEEADAEEGGLELTIFQHGKVVGVFVGESAGADFTALINKKGKLHYPHPIERTNQFIFKGDDSIDDINFYYGDVNSITPGQPWGDVTATQSDNNRTVTIEIDAGRHNDSSNADFFNDSVNSNGNKMIHTDHGSNIPAELNFAIKGVLEINGERFNVCLGQGHRDHNSDNHNNWHLASESLIADEQQKNGDLGNFYLAQNGTHQFDVSRK